MLSSANEPVIRATLPVVHDYLETITGVFYDTMLGENPELLDVFSRSGQATGRQRQALAGSVAAFAAHLIGEGGAGSAPMEVVVERIAHRHASLGIRPEQYTLVGRYLLDAVGTVLGDAVTPEVAAAWDEVYWLFACRLIGLEARLYTLAGVDPAQPWREYVVERRYEEAQDTVSFVLSPVDRGPTPAYLPGQYVTVAIDLPDGGRQLRQYSLSQAPTADALRITVRRVRGTLGAPDGIVSSYLHDQVRTGNRLALSAPYGDLTLRSGDNPLVLISAGVGITPMAAIIDHIGRVQPTREVVAVHADRSPDRHPLRAEMVSSGARLRSFRHLVWYERPTVGDSRSSYAAAVNGGAEPRAGSPEAGTDPTEVRSGLIDPDAIPLPARAEAYLCGPVPFMRAVRASLRRRGLPSERIRYEVFGPDYWTTSRAAATEPAPA